MAGSKLASPVPSSSTGGGSRSWPHAAKDSASATSSGLHAREMNQRARTEMRTGLDGASPQAVCQLRVGEKSREFRRIRSGWRGPGQAELCQSEPGARKDVRQLASKFE